MKKKINNLIERIQGKLKEWCGEITPDKRLIITLLILSLFTIANLYITFSSVYNWGKKDMERKGMLIERIQQPDTLINTEKHEKE